VIIPITFAETVRYFVSEIVNTDTINVCLDDILARSTVVPLTDEIAISAGSLKNREIEGFADAIILARTSGTSEMRCSVVNRELWGLSRDYTV
jgi:hypothetical protein